MESNDGFATGDLNLDEPVEIAPRVWWVGQMIPEDRFQCHPYLIEQGENSVLIDPGSALIASDIVRKIDRVVGVKNVRWLVCSHADPDIIGALPALVARGLHPEARIVTHWRDQVLIIHSGTPLGYLRIEEHEWRLDLEDRTLRFVFSPYLHFAGAFGTFDESNGTYFSGDLFGGFTDQTSLYAEGLEYFEAIRAFHEHYMPDREILAHTLSRLRELSVHLIAPQHGQILREALIEPMMDRLEKLETGVYLLAREDQGLRFLLLANQALSGLTNILIHESRFSAALGDLDQLARQTLGATGLELWARLGATTVHFAAESGYEGVEEPWPEDVEAAVQGAPVFQGTRLVWALYSLNTQQVTGAAVLHMSNPTTLNSAAREVLNQISGLVEVRLEREILERQVEMERTSWRNRALHDSLTGVLNRASMDGVLAEYVVRDETRESPRLVLLMMDLDQFKRVNDEFGHGVGDEVLRFVAEALRRALRPADVVFRYGGEEFLACLDDVTLEVALVVAERLRAAVARGPESLPPVTLSVGIAPRRVGESAPSMIERADAALYRAKAEGRDRLEVANDDG